MKNRLIKLVSWICFILGIIGIVICVSLLLPESGGLGITPSALTELNNWPVYGKEIVACINTDCNISNYIPDNLNCNIIEIAHVTPGNYHLSPVINCSGFDGEIHTHESDCSFSPQDYKAFQDRITHFNHWLAVLKCDYNKYFYMTGKDFKREQVKTQ